MKLTVIISAFIIITFSYCSKDDNNEEEICVIQKKNSMEHLVPYNYIERIERLFNNNDMTIPENIRFYRLEYSESSVWHVKCIQFWKEFQLFNKEVVYLFDCNDIFMSIDGELIENINIDTIPEVSNKVIGRKFYNRMKNDSIYCSHYQGKIEEYRENCYRTELGIWEMNSGQKDFVLVWQITPSDSITFPIAYYNSSTGYLIYYGNGYTNDIFIEKYQKIYGKWKAINKFYGEGVLKELDLQYLIFERVGKFYIIDNTVICEGKVSIYEQTDSSLMIQLYAEKGGHYLSLSNIKIITFQNDTLILREYGFDGYKYIFTKED